MNAVGSHITGAQMSQPAPISADRTLCAIRRVLAGALLFGMVGTCVELLLIGHYESVSQYAPTVLIPIGLTTFLWHLNAPGRTTVRVVRVVMCAFLALGAIGVGLHLKGNREFELEMNPTKTGWPLLQKTLSGATPVLAPGAMTLLGLVGLAQIHNHPVSSDAGRRPKGVSK